MTDSPLFRLAPGEHYDAAMSLLTEAQDFAPGPEAQAMRTDALIHSLLGLLRTEMG